MVDNSSKIIGDKENAMAANPSARTMRPKKKYATARESRKPA